MLRLPTRAAGQDSYLPMYTQTLESTVSNVHNTDASTFGLGVATSLICVSEPPLSL
jgi:hypothetical protein